MNEPVITLHNISKAYLHQSHGRGEKMIALKSINLTIMRGEFFVFIGPSGSGKSTLLRIMNGLDKEYEGSITLGSADLLSPMGFVFQQFAIFPWLTVFENVALSLSAYPLSDTVKTERVKNELSQLGLATYMHSYPRELSGGMKQRVGIARALVGNPKIIFMDEPFSELDSFIAKELRQELLTIWQERKTTIIMVSHVIQEAIELADRIAVFTPRPGTIEKIFTNPLPRPRKERSEPFYQLEDQLYTILKP